MEHTRRRTSMRGALGFALRLLERGLELGLFGCFKNALHYCRASTDCAPEARQ